MMTFALRDLQAAFAAHIMEDNSERLADAVVGDSIAAIARLRVHRHHVFHSLATALASTFATVRTLVGEDFFRTMARAYVARALPAQPVLTEYGMDFPAFVAAYAPAQGLPYLTDIARLEWALNVAFQAPRGAVLGVADLQVIPVEQLPAQRLVLAPGHALVCSPYPIDRIWAAAQPGAGAEALDLESDPAQLLVVPRMDDAAFIAVEAGEAAFLTALADWETLEGAAGRGLGADPGFDLSASFARFLGLGLFVALHQESDAEEI
jgi:hypothetical protein